MDEFRESLKGVRDLARIVGRLSGGAGNARDLRALQTTLEVLPELQRRGSEIPGNLNQSLSRTIDLEQELVAELARGVADEPPGDFEGGGNDPGWL